MSWQDIQKRTFTAWVNNALKVRALHVGNVAVDLRDGIKLINLLEVLSHKKLPNYNKHPKILQQKYENNTIVMDFLASEGIKTVNIGSADLVDGNEKIILGLIWTLILHYQVSTIGVDTSSAKSDLLKWIQSKIPEYKITNFTKDWNDGRAICALTNAIAEGSIPDHKSLSTGKPDENAARGINTAHNLLGIPPLIDAKDMTNPKVDEQSMMTYLSFFRDAAPQPPANFASQCVAYGPGLEEGIMNEESEFLVMAPKGGKLEVKVEGPASKAKVDVQQTPQPDGTIKYNVKYTPTEPGEYLVHVTLDGVHIPGSTFHVTVLEMISLGGEGKIRVYYSTTSSSEKGRKDVVNLQKMLEHKKIHERPDFEPWIPVDTMDKVDRDAVFKKAGTRTLPIVFIDDNYTGDHDKMVVLESEGKLDVLLNILKNKAQKPKIGK